MQPLNIRSWLEIWLSGTQYRRAAELSVDESRYALIQYLTETNPHSGKLRFADTYDLDRPEAEPALAICAELETARRKKDDAAVMRCLARLGLVCEQALMAAAMEKCDDLLRERAEPDDAPNMDADYSAERAYLAREAVLEGQS